MIVVNKSYKWAHGLVKRDRTDAIVLHHSDGYGTPEEIHQMHINKGWAGIGYHFYIRLDGTIYPGRPLEMRGAHTLNYNHCTVGVCCEGRYNEDGAVMPKAQMDSLHDVLRYLKAIYPHADIKCHRDYNATACPGKFFPFGEALNYTIPVPEVKKMTDRFRYISDLPYGKDEIQDFIDWGVINGTHKDDKGIVLDLSVDMLRVLIIVHRLFKIIMDRL